jgi:hypothetical protein
MLPTEIDADVHWNALTPCQCDRLAPAAAAAEVVRLRQRRRSLAGCVGQSSVGSRVRAIGLGQRRLPAGQLDVYARHLLSPNKVQYRRSQKATADGNESMRTLIRYHEIWQLWSIADRISDREAG